MNLALWLERAGKTFPDNPAVALGEKVIQRYGELSYRATQLAGSLKYLGLKVGDRVAIDCALVIDDDKVLLAHGVVDVAVFDALFLQCGESLGDVLLGDAAAFLLHLEPGVLRQLKRRGDLERGHVLERFAVAELQFLDLRHDDRLEFLLLERVRVTVGHEGALRLVGDLVAVGAHDVGQRGFAGAEPGQVCLPPKILGDGVKLGIHSLGIDFDAELFPAGGKVGYGDFHEILSVYCGGGTPRAGASGAA